MINKLLSQRLWSLVALSALLLCACAPGEGDDPGGIAIPPDMDAAAGMLDAAFDVDPPDALAECSDPGCACPPDSEPKICYPPPILSPTGTNLCAQGSMYCRDGVWSTCESLIQFGIDSQPASTESSTKSRPKTEPSLSGITSSLISTPTTCNPCHPSCFDAVDRPVATDLTASNSTLVTYDPVQAGIRLAIAEDTAQRGPLINPAVCGNGSVESVEQCDDGNARSADGCDSTCLLEAGYFCPIANSPCLRSICGNAVAEGLEQCDDGNSLIGDGCTFLCTKEPICITGSACLPVCGDGKIFPGEACDDGNGRSGDGCSAICNIEPGWNCVNSSASPPAYIDLPIVYRDFVGVGNKTALGTPFAHPDFENKNPGLNTGMVTTTWETNSLLPTYKKPVAVTPLKSNGVIASVASFNQWYTNDLTVNRTFPDTLRVTKQVNGTYVFDTTAFFPLDTKALTFPASLMENLSATHNFSFTSEVRFWFIYNPPQSLDFRGDDDVWVFINGKLAVDIGGVHSAAAGSVTLNASNAATYGLVAGQLYEAAVFQAERHTTGSNYRLTLAGFVTGKTSCTSVCGDGIVTPDEFCDDGAANGSIGACLPDCQGRSPKYQPTASYWRDYTATGTCKIPPERPLWGLLTWSTTTTSGGSITFNLQGAETAAGVATATPVPVSIVPSGGAGSFNIHDALAAAGLVSNPPYLRVTAVLSASGDQKQTPVLKQFDVSHTCVNVE